MRASTRRSLFNPTTMNLAILAITLSVAVSVLIFLLYQRMQDLKQTKAHLELLLKGGAPTVKVSHISDEDGLDIPEQDQDYLEPIIIDFLQQLVFTKVNTPTNAMLIEHLAEAIGMALEEFEPRKGRKDYQRHNKGWLLVAAYATRLYNEGTPHDSADTREQLGIIAHFSKDKLHKWAKHMTETIANKLRPQLTGETPGVKDVTEHIITASDGKYTRDEIEDMRKGLISDQFNERK